MDANAIETLRRAMPVEARPYAMPARTGLVVVDVVNGFCTPGCGPLAPPERDPAIEAMVARIDALARSFLALDLPVLAFLDTHEADRPEPPYPPHCVRGSGDEDLVPALAWLSAEPGATLLRKDCIDGFVGGFDAGGGNAVADWVRDNRLDAVVLVGICTDICVSDLATTLLSARNHVIAGEPLLPIRDVVVYEPGCATYDLPGAVAAGLGMPAIAAHPRAESHHVGLWTMQARGARIADRLDAPAEAA